MPDERTLATEVRELFEALIRHSNNSTRQAWAKHFKVREGSEQFYLAIANVDRKIGQLRDDIEHSSLKQASKDLYLGAVNTFAQYVTLDGLMGTDTGQIANQTKAFEYLALVDDFLKPLDHREFPEETLQELRSRIGELSAALEASDIEPRLKAFLRTHIANLLWAIDNYHSIGIEGVCRTFGSVHAEVVRSLGFHGAKSEAASGWFRKALPALGWIGMAITSASAVIEPADNLLTHGASIYRTLAGDAPAEGAADHKVEIKITAPGAERPATQLAPPSEAT